MAEIEKEITTEEVAPEVVADVAIAPEAAAPEDRRGANRPLRGRGGERGGRPNRASSRPPRAKSEFDQRMIAIRRVSRVVAGGRRFSFSVAIIIGNKKGKVGVGLGKAGDTTLAIDKAVRDAKKHMITVSLTKDSSIAHEVSAKYCAARISIMPAHGRGWWPVRRCVLFSSLQASATLWLRCIRVVKTASIMHAPQ